jgi:hypothetical protein
MGIIIPPRNDCETAVSCIILLMQRLHCELSTHPPYRLSEQGFRVSLKLRELCYIQKLQACSYPCA